MMFFKNEKLLDTYTVFLEVLQHVFQEFVFSTSALFALFYIVVSSLQRTQELIQFKKVFQQVLTSCINDLKQVL